MALLIYQRGLGMVLSTSPHSLHRCYAIKTTPHRDAIHSSPMAGLPFFPTAGILWLVKRLRFPIGISQKWATLLPWRPG
jgi:hypothetical protein